MKGTRLLPSHSPKTIESDRPAKQEDEKEEEHDEKPYILHLPAHIIVEILCKIPTKKIIQFRCVCKSFHRWLSDLEFIKDLFSRTPACFLIQDEKDGKNRSSRRNLPMSLFLADLNNSVTWKLFEDQTPPTHIYIVGSCNGIICIRRVERAVPSLYISNPITRESLPLPTHSMVEESDVSTFTRFWGFGFCPTSDVYKVVVIRIPNTSKKLAVIVMTVGSGIWRRIGNPGCHLPDHYHRDGVYLNGFLHWLGQSRESPGFICALDLERECFQQIPLPPGCSLTKPPTFHLGVLKGRLSITARVVSNMIIWVMRDYGVKSWTQELQISGTGIQFLYQPPQVLNLTKEGGVVVLDKSELRTYTPRTKGFARVEMDRVRFAVNAYVHTPSLVSLKDLIRT